MNAEEQRLQAAREEHIPWKKWGPYLSERQWGVVREDYSDNGDAWAYFTHDQARSRAVPLGGRRSGRHLRRQTVALLCAGVVEWPGPDYSRSGSSA